MEMIVKAAKDLDLYIGWSSISDRPTFAGNRIETLDHLNSDPHESRQSLPGETVLVLTDRNGSSDRGHAWCHWGDDGTVVQLPDGEQRWLKRGRVGAYAILQLGGDSEAAKAITEPLDGEDGQAGDVSPQ